MEKAKLALLCMQRHSWEQGVAAQAMYELGDQDATLMLCREAAYRALPDGRLGMMGDESAATDPCCVGEALCWAARETGDAALKKALAALSEWALIKAPRNKGGIVYHMVSSKQFWVDSMYMLPPFLAAIGEKEEALRQVEGYERALLDETEGLFCHQWDDAEKKYLRAQHWGVGNGWALTAYARLISLVPEESARLIGSARRLIGAVMKRQTKDGLFHDVVDDESTFIESNLTQMLCYTLCRGMREGWLDDSYRDEASLLHGAARARLDENGLAQGVCGAPHFDRPGVAPEGQAFYLMMENEWRRLSITAPFEA